jgi:hypothetical protein
MVSEHEPASVNTDQPSPARIYDYWLGGDLNFEADRAAGDRVLAAQPSLREQIWGNRAFLRRAVRRLVSEHGVRQFLDLGSGVPTVGNVHEIAHRVDADVRVVYVDIDPVATAHAQLLLADTPGVTAINADLRDVAGVLEAAGASLDFGAPVAVLAMAVFHFIPDSDRPAELIAGYSAPLVAGSCLAISHATPDRVDAAGQDVAAGAYRSATSVPFTVRTPAQIGAWLDGWRVLPPGIVPLGEWYPDPDTGPVPGGHGLLAVKD